MRRIFIILFCLLCASCAPLPSIDYDLMRAEDMRSPKDRLELLRREGERIAGSKFSDGNKVELLSDGAAAYPAMLRAIRSAHRRIDMESYEFDDEAGHQFAKALIKMRQAGVEVNLIYDSWGSAATSDELFDELRDGGVNVVEYNPIDPGSYIDFSVNERDHRKLLIIDGKTVFTGGINVSDVYKRKLKRILKIKDEEEDIDTLPWRDTQVKIEGPVVGEFEKFFAQTWQEQDGEPTLNPLPPPAKASGNVLVQAIEGAPVQDRFAIYRSLLVAIALSHSTVHLTTAYFVPTPDMVHVMQRAAKRGVQVVLVLPSQSDSDLALKAGHAYYEDLMEAGVHIYERQGAVLHAKTAVIDGVWSTVGSSNLDWRSVVYNNECNAVILGENFAKQMEKMFTNDLEQSRRIDPVEWDQRSFGQQFDEWRSRLIENFL